MSTFNLDSISFAYISCNLDILNFVCASLNNAITNKLLGLMFYQFIKNSKIINSGVFRKQSFWGWEHFIKMKTSLY